MRAFVCNKYPTIGIEQEFHLIDPSSADLEDVYEKLRAAGDVTAPSDLWWSIRLQPPLGTVELRIFDSPTDVRRIAAKTIET